MQERASRTEGANGAVESPPTEIQTWNIERFIPYARNPRKNDAAVDSTSQNTGARRLRSGLDREPD
jgi:hypothetical protein